MKTQKSSFKPKNDNNEGMINLTSGNEAEIFLKNEAIIIKGLLKILYESILFSISYINNSN